MDTNTDHITLACGYTCRVSMYSMRRCLPLACRVMCFASSSSCTILVFVVTFFATAYLPRSLVFLFQSHSGTGEECECEELCLRRGSPLACRVICSSSCMNLYNFSICCYFFNLLMLFATVYLPRPLQFFCLFVCF